MWICRNLSNQWKKQLISFFQIIVWFYHTSLFLRIWSSDWAEKSIDSPLNASLECGALKASVFIRPPVAFISGFFPWTYNSWPVKAKSMHCLDASHGLSPSIEILGFLPLQEVKNVPLHTTHLLLPVWILFEELSRRRRTWKRTWMATLISFENYRDSLRMQIYLGFYLNHYKKKIWLLW